MGWSRRNLNKSLPSSFAQQQWQMVYPNFQLICSVGQRKGVSYHLVFTVTYGDGCAYYFNKAQNSIHAPGAHSPAPPYYRFKVMLYGEVVKQSECDPAGAAAVVGGGAVPAPAGCTPPPRPSIPRVCLQACHAPTGTRSATQNPTEASCDRKNQRPQPERPCLGRRSRKTPFFLRSFLQRLLVIPPSPASGPVDTDDAPPPR